MIAKQPAPAAQRRADEANRSSDRRPPPRKLRRFETWAIWIGRLVVGTSVAIVWEWAARAHLINPVFIGQPSLILASFVDGLRGSLVTVDAAYTTFETVIGFVLASAAGIFTAFLLSQSRTLYAIFEPYFTALNSLPRVALAPLFLIWFGIGATSKIALAASLTYFVVFAATIAGVESVEPDHRLLARLMGASRWQFFTRFVVPSATPSIFAGLQLGLIYGMLGAVAGEMVAGQHGLGVRLTHDANQFATNSYFATLLLLALITIVISLGLRILRGRLLRWQESTHR